jgi:hypothetical protein
LTDDRAPALLFYLHNSVQTDRKIILYSTSSEKGGDDMPDDVYQAQFPDGRFRPIIPAIPGGQLRPPERRDGPQFGPPGRQDVPPSGPSGRQFIPPFRPPGGIMGPTPGMPGQQGGPPQGPPPSFVPAQRSDGISVRAVDPGAIRPCLFRFVYIWLENGRQFWAWLVFVGPRSVAGWRWNGFRWVYFGTDLENISSFICY